MCKLSCCGTPSFVSRLLRQKQQSPPSENLIYFQPAPELNIQTIIPQVSDTDSFVTIPLSDSDEKVKNEKVKNEKTKTWKPDFLGKKYWWV